MAFVGCAPIRLDRWKLSVGVSRWGVRALPSSAKGVVAARCSSSKPSVAGESKALKVLAASAAALSLGVALLGDVSPAMASVFHLSGTQSKSITAAVADLKKVIEAMPGANIVEERPLKSKFGEGYYLRAEFESNFFGFVDDFEALFQPEKVGTAGFESASGIVDYRSASRLGEGDFNANRNRVKALRVELQKEGWSSLGFR